MPDDGLSGQLETRRASLITANRELLAAAQSANRATTAEEDTRYDANMTEIRALNTRLDDLADQAQREERARAARAGDASTEDDGGSGARASGAQVTSEPTHLRPVQRRTATGWTWRATSSAAATAAAAWRSPATGWPGTRPSCASSCRSGRSGAAQRPAARSRACTPGSRREERALRAVPGAGMQVFEQRAINRTDGTGGYFVPPLWLVDQYVPYLRAGRVLANLCHSLPLPGGTDSINLPIGSPRARRPACRPRTAARCPAGTWPTTTSTRWSGRGGPGRRGDPAARPVPDRVRRGDQPGPDAGPRDAGRRPGDAGLRLRPASSRACTRRARSPAARPWAIIVNGVTGTTTAQWVGPRPEPSTPASAS